MNATAHVVLRLPFASPSHEISICFDKAFGYIATTKAAWRFRGKLAADTQLEPIRLPPGEVHSLCEAGGKVFLLKAGGEDGHTLLRSFNHGDSFEPIDGGLQIPGSAPAERLVPTRLAIVDDQIFTNAGGGRNLLCGANDGRNWTLLSGLFANSACYAGKFLVLGSVVMLGGECPLDSAYLLRGTLTSRGTGWQTPPSNVAPSDLSNRNVQFIALDERRGVMFAGVEGGLLQSTDGGFGWTWVRQFGVGIGQYPYITQIGFPTHVDTCLVGGYDKANNNEPYVALLSRGLVWTDISKVINSLGTSLQTVQRIIVDPYGRVLVATRDDSRGETLLAEIVLS